MFRVLFAALFLASVSVSTGYDGYEVWRIDVEESQLTDVITKFDLDVWSHGKSYLDVMVSPEEIQTIKNILSERNIHYEVMIPNVQELIDAEEERRAESKEFSYDQYNTFDDIEDKLINISSSNPNATLISLGLSFEGRNQWQIRFSTGGSKPIAWFDCGIHAREWISPATCLYGIDKFDQNDPQFAAVLDRYEVRVVPVLNVDGYEFTWSGTDLSDNRTRLWRKNRYDNSNVDETRTNETCYGVDLNRNFDAYWGGLGSTNVTCASTYRGVSVASEIETQNVQNAILAEMPRVLFSIHSYSQLWMYPYSYDYVTPPQPIADELDRVAGIGVEALTATYGTNYTYGPTAETIYPASGTSVDFAFDAGANYSYVLELRDTGEYGFLLPEDQITPTGEETWNGIIAALDAIP